MASETAAPIPRPRNPRLSPLQGLDIIPSSDGSEIGTPTSERKKKKSSLARLKAKKTTSSEQESKEGTAEIGSKLAEFQIGDDTSEEGVNEWTKEREAEMCASPMRKKKNKGALSRLKEKRNSVTGSQISVRSQEVVDLRADDKVESKSANSPGDEKSAVSEDSEEAELVKIHEQATTEGKLRPQLEKPTTQNSLPHSNHLSSENYPPVKLLDNVNMSSLVESDSDEAQIQNQYERLLSTEIRSSLPAPTKSNAGPLRRASLISKSDSTPNLHSTGVRSSKRDWETLRSKIGILDSTSNALSASDLRRSVSTTSMNTTASSGIHSIKMSTARHRNFLVGQKDSYSSLMGATELERLFPDRNIDIFVGTFNIADTKTVPESLDDFLLPLDIEYVPNIIVINTQENALDKRQWEIALQETIGTNHVLYQSTQFGSLHIAVFIKRELIWYCSVAESDGIAVRAVKQIKTKGAAAISFTLFGTSMIFIGCHFTAGESEDKSRVADFNTINAGLKLPKVVIDNPLQKADPKVSNRFDCVFWAGDMNFRITKEREAVLQMIEANQRHEHPQFENILDCDELTQSISQGEIFQNYQEGRITFAPSYKFDIGTDNYDTSTKFRIPSYTDRILFKCRKKHSAVCLKYNTASSVKMSDHKPVYGLYQVNLKPGKDSIPLSGGNFKRDIYMEAARKRALHREASTGKPATQSSSICSIM